MSLLLSSSPMAITASVYPDFVSFGYPLYTTAISCLPPRLSPTLPSLLSPACSLAQSCPPSSPLTPPRIPPTPPSSPTSTVLPSPFVPVQLRTAPTSRPPPSPQPISSPLRSPSPPPPLRATVPALSTPSSPDQCSVVWKGMRCVELGANRKRCRCATVPLVANNYVWRTESERRDLSPTRIAKTGHSTGHAAQLLIGEHDDGTSRCQPLGLVERR